MLGCIQPISSPMMKRMLGFCPCAWAGAGRLAIVVAVLNATRALQIVLNGPMVAFPFSAAKLRAAAFARLHPPTDFYFCQSMQRHVSGNRSDALRAGDWSKQTGCAMQLRQELRFCLSGSTGVQEHVTARIWICLKPCGRQQPTSCLPGRYFRA